MTIHPNTIPITNHPIVQGLINTLGRAELEFAAALVIRYHQAHGLTEWTPLSRNDIAKLFEKSNPDPIVAVWARNPFWNPDPYELANQGFITGWMEGPDAKGTFTLKFFEAVEHEHARRGSA